MDQLLAQINVGAVWGVGKKIGARLLELGVRSVLDLVRCDSASLRRQFNVVLEKTILELRRTSCLEITDAPAAKQQILVSRSFGTAITRVDGIVEPVSEFASRAAEKLRAQESVASAVNVFFSTSPYRPHDRQHGVSVTVPLVRPSADTRLLVSVAADTAAHQFRSGFNYAKAGAMLLGLQPASQVQHELDLFADEATTPAQAPDRPALMAAMDSLNKRFGRDAVRIGTAILTSHGTDLRVWATRQDRRSPRFTTRWDEMPVVKA